MWSLDNSLLFPLIFYQKLCEVVYVFLSFKTCHWEWTVLRRSFGHTIRTFHFIPSNLATKTLWHILIWWEGTGLDGGLQVTVIFFPSFFCSTTNQTRGGCAPSKLPLVKARDETGRKCVLLLRARLQWDFKVFWLNAFIWKGSLRKAATWLGTAMAVKSQQQGGFWVLCSIRKQAAWIGLSWQLGWVRKRLKWMEGNGRRNEKERVGLSLSAPVDS